MVWLLRYLANFELIGFWPKSVTVSLFGLPRRLRAILLRGGNFYLVYYSAIGGRISKVVFWRHRRSSLVAKQSKAEKLLS